MRTTDFICWAIPGAPKKEARYHMMRLFYHFSNENVSVLKPMLGPSRHGGEDDAARDRPAVWLATTDVQDLSNDDDAPCLYRYEVEVDDGDPALHADAKMASLMDDFNQLFGTTQSAPFFWYEKEVPYIRRAVWDKHTQSYVPES